MVKIGQNINLQDADSLYNVIIEMRDSQIKMINGEKYVIYKSHFQTDKKLLKGIFECTIVGDESTIFDIILDKFYSIFNFS